MQDDEATREQLLEETRVLRQRIAQLEDLESEGEQANIGFQTGEELLRHVVSGAPLVLWAVDQAGVFTLSEGKGLDALGLTPGEVVGQSVFELYREEPRILHDIHRGLSGEDFISDVEVAGRVFESRYAPLRNEKGVVSGLIGVSCDITERKQAEEALREQINRNEQILQTTMDGYILADTEGRLIDVNSAYCENVGYSRQELLRMNIGELEVKLSPEEVERRIESMVERGWDRFETQHRHKDGAIVDLDVSIVIMTSPETPLVAAFVRDITDRKRAEAALNQRLRELEALNRLFQQHLGERFAVVEAYRELLDSLETESDNLSELLKRARSHPLPDLRDVVSFEPDEHSRSEQ